MEARAAWGLEPPSALTTPPPSHARTRIQIPPKHCPTSFSYMTTMLPTFNTCSSDELYSSLVKSTHDFYTRYVTRPHLTRLHNHDLATFQHLYKLHSPPSKVLERIFLNRLMFRLQNKLSPRLYGFLPQRGTHHCLYELYSRLSPTSVAAFIDLKSAFDIASREVILDQLVAFGVKGSLLRWTRSYLSNRTARVLFRGACSTSKGFDLGTPQGGVLSPFLFNVLMHRLLSLLPDSPGIAITCYADDICIHAYSAIDLQQFLHAFYASSTACGLVISPEKSRMFSTRNPQTLPVFTVGGSIVPHCIQYTYLGSPVRITQAMPAQQRIHPIVKELLDRLEQRFIPVKCLANNMKGVSIPVAKTIYIKQLSLEAIASVSASVPAAHHLYVDGSLQADRSAACAVFSPTVAPPGDGNMLMSDVNARMVNRRNPERPDSVSFRHYDAFMDTKHKYLRHGLMIRRHNVKQLSLEAIASVSASVPAAHHLYVDGSLQADRSAACAVFSPTVAPPGDGNMLMSDVNARMVNRRNPERPDSVSFRHYDAFMDTKHKYLRHGLMIRRHNV
ncbi:uncharacterized protein LOC126991114, partial [Eriocheir sinensis]|uniref:uncharacterized protein LOC126991114 n=1 Tax=Eriocheir sinensis TaxID=95602 RepID=UPI0021C9AF26